jgi:TM2 domain-containing membrane protein YozV
MALTTEEKMLVEQRVNNDAKSPLIAWMLWLFLGVLGIHRFYLNRPHAVTMLILYLVGLFTAFFLIGIPLLIAVMVMWVMDAFKIGEWVNDERAQMRKRLTDEASA